MNRHRHRLVFNALRGQPMAVSEIASAAPGASSTRSARNGPRRLASPRWRALSAAVLLAWCTATLSPAHAQIAADPGAPGSQRPTVLAAPNGVPVVNIQTPSAAGVSRNTYRQFDVQGQGAILNNSRTNVQTQLGGWVQGNPWLAGGSARVILNEVNSANPTQLRGFVEVAGQRAEVVIANPAGIQVNGAGFINASAATLTTGLPIVNGGNLEGYRVQGGTVRVEGLGLDATLTDHAAILARAVEVNAGIWARHLTVATGANQVNADPGNVSTAPAAAQGATPSYALDVAHIGGMYAGHIYLVGTEAGLGARNAGVISSTGQLVLDHSGWLSNRGTLQAAQGLTVAATSLDNAAGAVVSAGTTTVQLSQALTNRGLIDGQTTQLQAQSLSNLGTGRLYGNVLAIEAQDLLNDTETVGGVRSDAVMAARERLDIGAQNLVNREGALVFSAGDMAIGGSLDAAHRAAGTAQRIENRSATIEALGSLAMATRVLENANDHFTYTVVRDGTSARTDYYTAGGYVGSEQVAWSVVERGDASAYTLDPTTSGTRLLPSSSAYANPAYRAFYLGPTPFVAGQNVWVDQGDTGYVVWVPDTYGYDRDSPIWAAMGMTAPAWSNPGQMPRPVPYADDSGQSYPVDPVALAQWQAHIQPWLELNTRVQNLKSTVAAQLVPTDLFRQYTETTQRAEVTASQPGRIVSGAGMALNIGQSARNQDSHIVAGGSLSVSGGAVNNQGTLVSAPTQRSGTLSQWAVVGQRCSTVFGCEPIYDWAQAAYAESIQRTVTLPSTRYEPNAAPGQLPLSGTSLPGSRLFTLQPGSTSAYLVETDPRFANYRQWVSSDYLLQALNIDANTLQKRMGDGFYEQKLVREQVAALTGQRFLGDHTSDEAQYQALMTAGATFARAHNLRPGVALSAEHVAQLTSDIVWLVTEAVSLPDGSTTQVLTPRVYTHPRAGDLAPSGALLAGQSVTLNLSGDITQSGTLNGRQLTQITAQNVHHLGGQIGGGARTVIQARDDIRNIGGSIAARDGLTLNAGRDITVQSTTSVGAGDTGEGVYSSQGIDRVAGLYVSKDAGVLIASAGRDVQLGAALVQSAGSVQVQAGGSIDLDTVQTATSMNATRDARNFTRIEHAGEIGTRMEAAASVSLNAGQDVNARAATVQAGGELKLQAGRDVSLTAGEQSLSIDTASYARARSGLNSGSTERKEQRSDTSAIASSVGGERVRIQSARDTAVQSSSVIGDAGVNFEAGGSVNILAAQTASARTHYLEQKNDGVSFEGAGITYGSQRQSTDQDERATRSAASTVGAITGHVNITAGKTYTQTGSDVMAPGGDITISAQNVQINEARETSRREVEQQFEKTGITLALSTPVLDAMQTVTSQMEAAGDTKDARMKGLAAANSAFAVSNALDKVSEGASKAGANAAQQAGGVNLTISIGSSSSASQSLETTDTARGSTVSAGGNVSISASGAGRDSHLLIQGSDVTAGGNARLSAEGDVSLLAAQNTASLSGRNQSASGSVGISFGTSGFGVSASVSSSRGKEAGDDLIHTHTHISAGNTVRIQSGNDTTLQGALVKADTIQADVGGDLKIESLQDTSTYTSQQKSSSASVTVGAGVSGSFSSSKSNVKSDFASVAEQSGLKAGDGGFQVRVGGNTDLIGGAITSNQVAVEQGRNRFSTGGTLTTSDMENTAEYTAKSASVSLSGGSDENKKNTTTSGVGAGVGRDTGGASSTTRAGISGIAGDTALRSTDAETGIARIFEKEAVQRDIDAQARITEAFSREAPKAVASYAANQSNALREQLRTETDPARRAALQAEMDHWSEGGLYRVALHTVAGALGGGVNGALGAAASSASAPVMDALQDTLQQSLMAAGLGATAAKGVAQGITTLTAAGVGAAVGGTYGAASASTVDANNRQLHPSERRLAQELAGKSNGKYTAEQVEEQMRLMGNKAFNEPANKTEVLTTTQAIASNIAQDPNMPKAIDGMSVVEIPGQANAELQQYIIGNSQGADYIPGQSPYTSSNTPLRNPMVTTMPAIATATAACANGNLACKSGVGMQQNAPLTPTQQVAIGKYFGDASTTYQRAAAFATAAGNAPVALSFEIASGVAGLLEQAFLPSAGKVLIDTLIVDEAAKAIATRLNVPLPVVVEVVEREIKPRLQNARDSVDRLGAQ